MSHRKPPLSPVRRGFCRWCDEAIEPRLKKNGQPRAIQASMHRPCSDEYWRAQNASCHTSDLRKRDGNRCRQCGPGGKFLEIDHRVPLWKVAHLPPAKRRQYFLPGNLQLLCCDCHKRKSGKESAERAHHKRLVEPKKPKGRKLPVRPFGPSRGFDTRLRRKLSGKVEVRT